MTSKQEGSCEFSKKAKKEIRKRAWTTAEEEVLLDGLKGLVADGWKFDNGFRGGYMNVLEDSMRKAFLGTDLRGRPHIDSKLTAWKKWYAALRDILARSGVGFNVHGDHKIDCENGLWEEICRPDPSIKNWRNKSWPYLETWNVVFGKDRATGDGAVEFMDMVNEVILSDKGPNEHGEATEESPINLDESPPQNAPTAQDSAGQSNTSNAKPSKTNKKRQFEDIIGSLVDLVGDIQHTNKAKYEVFNSAFGRQAQVNKSKGSMWPLLRQIEGLAMEDMFEIGEKLLKMPECLELFMELEEDARPAYVDRIRRM